MSVSWNDEDEAAIPPRGSLMQLELAECVETKTVTTTTTTKRSYPPLYFHELRSLCSLDAKEYPLAMKPTPPELSRFTIDLDEFYHNDPWASLGSIPRDSSVESQSSQPQPSHQRHGRGAKTIFLPGRGQESIPSHDLTPANNNTFSRRAAARAASLSASPSASASRKALRSAAAVATTADIPLAVSDRLRRAVSGPGKKDGNGKELLVEKPQTRATPTKYLATPDNSLVAAPSSHPVRGTRLRPFRPDRTTETQEAGSSSGAGSGTGSGTGSGSGSGPSSGQTSFLYDAASPTGSDSHTIFGNSVATPPILGADAEPFADTEETLQDTTRALPPRVLGTVGMLDASLPSPRLSPTLSATANPLSASADEDPDELEDSPLSRLLTRQDHAWAQSQSAADDGRGNGSLLVLSSDEQQDLAQHDDYKDRGSGGKRHDSGADSGLMATTISRSTFVETRSLLERFDALPNEMQTFMMYQFLRRCTRKTLHMVADVVNPALKCDFLKRLPLELSFHILSYLEYRDLCRAAQVSKHWRNITDCNETGWKELFDRDGYQLSMGELQKAISQGWGWQDPVGPEGCEIDLSVRNRMASSESELLRSSAAAASSRTDQPSSVRVRTSKRKRGIAAYPSTDRAKRRVSGAAQEPHKDEFSSSSFSSSTSSPLPFSSSATAAAVSSYSSSSSLWPRLYKADGPIAAANAAAVAVPEPEIGIPSIRKLHLFKSLYRRHHMIRKSWTSGKVKPSHVAFTAHPRHVITCLQFDDEKIITGSDDTLIHVYDTKTGKLLKKLEGHEGGVWALQYEGNVLVSGSTDRSVRVWDIEKGRCTQVFYGHTSTVRCLQILMPSKTGRYVDGKPEMMPPNPLVITGSRDNQLRVWRLPQAGSPRYIQTGPPANDSECPYFMRILSGHTNSVRSIAAHGDVLVSGSYDSTVRVWRISTGEALHVLEGHSQRVYSVVLDTKRNRCISGSMDSFVKIWDLDTGACLHTLEGHALLVGLLDLREEKLVSAAADSTLRVWDPQTGRCKSTLTAHTGAITCFQHDGRKVISGSEKTVKMWDIQTGECIQDLLTDLTGVWQVKFDERRCVAAVQRDNLTYVEILDFGAVRDGKPPEELGKRILLNAPEVQALIEEEA